MSLGSSENFLASQSSIYEPSATDSIRSDGKVSKFLLVVVAFSALTGLLMGFDLSVVAVVLNPIQEQFKLCPEKEFSCFKRELFVSMIAPGALVGSIGGGWFADMYGRRMTLILSDGWFIVGSVMFYLAHSFTVLLIARFAVGTGVGIGFVVFSTYIAEISPSSIRGRLVVCQEVAQCVGVLLTFLVASIVGDPYWRLLLASGGFIALLQLCGIALLPESPRWLMMQNNPQAALEVMRKLGMDMTELSQGEEELRKVGSGVVQQSTWYHLKSSKKTILTACFVGLAQNVLCLNAALYYSTDLFLLAGVCKPYQWGIGLGVMKLIGTIIVFATVDTLGRRTLLLSGTGGLFFVFIILTVSYSIAPKSMDVDAASRFCQTATSDDVNAVGLAGVHSILMLVGLFGLVLMWELSWAGLMYVVASEIIPSTVRGIGMGIVTFCFWFSLFLSQILFERMFHIITVAGTFVGLCIASVVIFMMTWYLVPDMTGKSLENIGRLLSNTYLQGEEMESTKSFAEKSSLIRRSSAAQYPPAES